MGTHEMLERAGKRVVATSDHWTEVGSMRAHWSELGLYRLDWSEASKSPENVGKIRVADDAHPLAFEFESALLAYFAGDFEQLDAIRVDDSEWTPFFAKVYRACRDIPPGRTISYSQLATKAGSSGAARAVGQAMATNRLPLVIPCHRVVGAGGRLCGYSGPGGLTMKRRLLDLEQAAVPSLLG